MSIPLFRFPLLALDEILKSMSYSEIFNLSVCSERLGNYMARYLKFENVAKICYIFQQRLMFVDVEEYSGKIHPLVRVDCEESLGQMDRYICKIGGTENSFKFAPSAIDATRVFFHCNRNSENSVKNSVIRHCSNLFERYPPIVQLRLVAHESLGFVPSLESVEEVRVHGKYILAEDTINYFPNLHCLRISGPCTDRENYSGVENLQCDYVGSHTFDILGSFTGGYLYLHNAKMSTVGLMNFCTSWQRNELCQNLRLLYINLYELTQPFDPEMFFAEFETQEWDPNMRPEGPYTDFPYMVDVHDVPYLIIDGFRDIQRTDGTWASLGFMNTDFFMVVWN